ncbi:hypothetical protein SERLA73DRAFT_65909 [Serpula lacrymans var. lacrymans S7.3]|uniref:Adenylate kinase n=1 Tax=Serpula lacrymans var. lacrymans (strain S7.3) TaxID=936435 RepID=F8QH32_SERL3|nr:hypothetical protein SERLA73DRAFT_65909 [Serpula lacrymans var. lacrymans S7.3]
MEVPPLLGDEQGRYRIHIIGNVGSTLGLFLAQALNIPYVPLDTLYWLPGWERTSDAEFCLRVRGALDRNSRGWVADGQYPELESVMQDATDIIWLDPPLFLYLPRLLRRTVARLFRITPPCSPGCEESLREMLSTKGIIWWCLSHHRPTKKKQQELIRHLGVDVGGTMRRIGGWGSESKRYKERVEEMLRMR